MDFALVLKWHLSSSLLLQEQHGEKDEVLIVFLDNDVWQLLASFYVQGRISWQSHRVGISSHNLTAKGSAYLLTSFLQSTTEI